MSDGQISFTFTRKLAADMTNDAATKTAVLDALRRFTRDDWGKVPQEDKDANDRDKAAGVGRVLARYETPGGDIYIISYPGMDEPITALYCSEY